MTIKAVTPSDAARSPNHPDHARWVKEQTLKLEADHAAAVGLSGRDAEVANLANLERMDARKRQDKPKQRKKKVDAAKREVTHADLIKAGVTKKTPEIRKVKPRACGYCGVCVSCRREVRVRLIMGKAREGDTLATSLCWELAAIVFAKQKRTDYRDYLGREFPFSRLQGADVRKASNRAVDLICDRSVRLLGEWR